MFLKVYKGGIVSLQGASFSRKSKKRSGNKLGLLVLMMDEGSVMERAYFTVVPLTAVLRSISIAQQQMCLVLLDLREWI